MYNVYIYTCNIHTTYTLWNLLICTLFLVHIIWYTLLAHHMFHYIPNTRIYPQTCGLISRSVEAMWELFQKTMEGEGFSVMNRGWENILFPKGKLLQRSRMEELKAHRDREGEKERQQTETWSWIIKYIYIILYIIYMRPNTTRRQIWRSMRII